MLTKHQTLVLQIVRQVWKPKTSPSVSYGTNGFFLDFANSSSMGNDISGNNNDWNVAGNLKQCLTTPSNIFVLLMV